MGSQKAKPETFGERADRWSCCVLICPGNMVQDQSKILALVLHWRIRKEGITGPVFIAFRCAFAPYLLRKYGTEAKAKYLQWLGKMITSIGINTSLVRGDLKRLKQMLLIRELCLVNGQKKPLSKWLWVISLHKLNVGTARVFLYRRSVYAAW
jgi:hypothetical protein